MRKDDVDDDIILSVPDGVVDLVPGVPEVPLDQQQLSNIQAVVPDIIQLYLLKDLLRT